MVKELLSIAMVLEEFHSMLLVAVLFKHTNHTNLSFATLNWCSILHWHFLWKSMVPPTSIILAIK